MYFTPMFLRAKTYKSIHVGWVTGFCCPPIDQCGLPTGFCCPPIDQCRAPSLRVFVACPNRSM